MATKLYLRSTSLNPFGSAYLDLLTTAGAGMVAANVSSVASGTDIQWTATAGGTIIQWITPPIAADFTLTSTDINIWAYEDVMTANIGGRYRIFKRATTGIETDIGGGPFDDGVEFVSVAGAYAWTGNVTDTAFVIGDRILLKVYITNIGTMAAGTGTLDYNGGTGAADGDTFLNLAETVTFQPERPRGYVFGSPVIQLG